jgi:hypothetical protein
MVNLFFKIKDMEELFQEAVADPKIGGESLSRNFRRLLGSYSLDLRSFARSEVQKEVAIFVKSNSRYISSEVRARVDNSMPRPLHDLKKKREDIARNLNDYIAGLGDFVDESKGVNEPSV